MQELMDKLTDKAHALKLTCLVFVDDGRQLHAAVTTGPMHETNHHLMACLAAASGDHKSVGEVLKQVGEVAEQFDRRVDVEAIWPEVDTLADRCVELGYSMRAAFNVAPHKYSTKAAGEAPQDSALKSFDLIMRM